MAKTVQEPRAASQQRLRKAMFRELTGFVLRCSRSARRGTRSRRIRQSEWNLQQGRKALTAGALLEHLEIGLQKGDIETARLVARAIHVYVESFAPTLPRDRNALWALETKLEGEVNQVQQAIACGDRSLATLLRHAELAHQYNAVLLELALVDEQAAIRGLAA